MQLLSGHGETTGIVLEDTNGQSYLLPPKSLADLLSLFTHSMEYVILNSCYSQKQAEAIVQYTPYVIGMNAAIPDKTAIRFAIGFYSGISSGRNVPDSFKLGKVSISADGLKDDMILLLRK
ncbi:hypothetical protein [Xanthocytophaga flava]|uniref:hypothetical protein n=1 Tax=Xanthocytophaga flava TaxID=3048013 RepID=UPI0028D1FE8A|nr:hypothetical protein [Xanthocytophaga flavus]MDJ1470257.1 hypothetical protein [Xanthocytophaga flavus]